MRLPLVVFAAAAATVPLAAAQTALPADTAATSSPATADAPLPGVVVTATRIAEPVDRVIGDITVIDADPARSALSPAEALRFSGGVQMTSNGGPGSTGALLLRGANAGHTLTLVDGFRVGSSSLGQPTYETLPFGLHERVEILRGPASSLYGADALGGVIQFRSPVARPGLRGDAAVALGQEGTRQARAGLSGGNDVVTGAIRLGTERSDGFDATTPTNFSANPDRDGYRRDAVSARVDARLGAATRLSGIALQNRLETDFDDGAFAGARTKARIEVVGLTVSHAFDARTELEARVGQTADRSEAISNFPGTFRSRLMQYGVSGTRRIDEGLQVKLLYERLEEKVDATAYAGVAVAKRTTDSLGAIVTADRGPHRVQAGLRRDDSSQYGAETNVTLAYGYRLGSGVRVGGSHATGFHAPGFNDLYFPGYGRPGIRPEQARTTEIGAYWNAAEHGAGASTPAGGSATRSGTTGSGTTGSSRWHGKAVVFQSDVRDLITYAPVCPDPDPQFVFGCADNVDRARIRGVSFGIGQRTDADARRGSGLAWSLDADLLDPQNRTTDTELPRRARRQLTARIDYGRGPWSFGADLLAASRRFDDAANLNRLGGYALINLRGSYALTPEVELFAALFNAGDRPYTTAYGYRQQGRLALLGVRYAAR
ncbi:MAG: TonB-dependent receptor [Lautropia sp.]